MRDNANRDTPNDGSRVSDGIGLMLRNRRTLWFFLIVTSVCVFILKSNLRWYIYGLYYAFFVGWNYHGEGRDVTADEFRNLAHNELSYLVDDDVNPDSGPMRINYTSQGALDSGVLYLELRIHASKFDSLVKRRKRDLANSGFDVAEGSVEVEYAASLIKNAPGWWESPESSSPSVRTATFTCRKPKAAGAFLIQWERWVLDDSSLRLWIASGWNLR